MTEPAAAISSQAFAIFQNESTWGTAVVGTERYIPLTSYGVKLNVESRDAKPFVGVLESKLTERYRANPAGQIQCPLYGFVQSSESFAQTLLRWAFQNIETLDRESKTVHWIEQGAGGTKKKHAGLRVTSATLEGSQSGGFLNLNLDVIGQSEAASTITYTLPDNRAGLSEFLFSDVSLVLNGGALPLDSFQWSVNYGLKPTFNDYTPNSLRPTTKPQHTLNIRLLKSGDAWEVYQRLTSTTNLIGMLTFKGLHGGTGASGTYCQCVATFNRLCLTNAEDAIADGELIQNPLTFNVLKPNVAAAAVSMAWSLV